MGNNMKKVLYLNGGGGMERKPPGKSILKQQAISPHYSNPLLTDNIQFAFKRIKILFVEFIKPI